MLSASDRLRKRSRAYRRGWNSVVGAPPPPPVIATTPASAPPGFSSGGLIILGLLCAGAWSLAARRKASRTDAKPLALPTSARPQPQQRPKVPATPAPTPPATSLRRRRSGDLQSESDAAWRREADPVEVQGIRIVRGLIYIGRYLTAKDGYGQTENCLINPALSIAAGGNPDAGLTYWPSYSRLPSATRRAYLEWLASGRDDPATPVGYVFLYFYGLERRLMFDQVADERPSLVREVERLRGIYGGNASFRGYSQRLLNAASALCGRSAPCEPILKREGSDIPLRLRETLGRFAAARTPIPADWMLSWVMNHPELSVRSPATRDMDSFRALFELRWSAAKRSRASFRKNLVFATSRDDVEEMADLLRERTEAEHLPQAFHAHHGNLSRGHREFVEERLKDQDRPATAICTSTLELGIDIGAIDSVAQIGPPFTVSSLRQRLGRSGRREGRPAILRMYVDEPRPDARSDLLDRLNLKLVQSIAMLRLLIAKCASRRRLRGHICPRSPIRSWL